MGLFLGTVAISNFLANLLGVSQWIFGVPVGVVLVLLLVLLIRYWRK